LSLQMKCLLSRPGTCWKPGAMLWKCSRHAAASMCGGSLYRTVAVIIWLSLGQRSVTRAPSPYRRPRARAPRRFPRVGVLQAQGLLKDLQLLPLLALGHRDPHEGRIGVALHGPSFGMTRPAKSSSVRSASVSPIPPKLICIEGSHSPNTYLR